MSNSTFFSRFGRLAGFECVFQILFERSVALAFSYRFMSTARGIVLSSLLVIYNYKPLGFSQPLISLNLAGPSLVPAC